MKREDMGRNVLHPTRSARNPRIEKILSLSRKLPELRFSQAGKAPGSSWGGAAASQAPARAHKDPLGADSHTHRRACDRGLSPHTAGDDSRRFPPGRPQ